MKYFFWTQAIWALVGCLLGLVVGITGGHSNIEFDRYSVLTFTVSAGFLWIHSAISKLKVKP